MRAAAWAMIAMMVLSGSGTQAAPAPESQPSCPRDAQPVPPEFASWAARMPLVSAAGVPGPALQIGQAYDVALHPDAELRLPSLPGSTADRVGSGGAMSFNVARGGHYRIALGEAAWVDVVRDGRPLKSTGHAHGPACSGIRKIVDFDLTPGRYTSQSTAATPGGRHCGSRSDRRRGATDNVRVPIFVTNQAN